MTKGGTTKERSVTRTNQTEAEGSHGVDIVTVSLDVNAGEKTVRFPLPWSFVSYTYRNTAPINFTTGGEGQTNKEKQINERGRCLYW